MSKKIEDYVPVIELAQGYYSDYPIHAVIANTVSLTTDQVISGNKEFQGTTTISGGLDLSASDITGTASNIALTSGNITVTSGNLTVTNGNLGVNTGDITVTGGNVSAVQITASGLIFPQQHATTGAPAYVKGAIYFDTSLNKLRVGGAAGWETITSA